MLAPQVERAGGRPGVEDEVTDRNADPAVAGDSGEDAVGEVLDREERALGACNGPAHGAPAAKADGAGGSTDLMCPAS